MVDGKLFTAVTIDSFNYWHTIILNSQLGLCKIKKMNKKYRLHISQVHLVTLQEVTLPNDKTVSWITFC